MEVNRWVTQKIAKFKRKSSWHPFTKILMLVVQFVVVMLVLFCGAVVLARMEDPDMFYENNGQHQQQSTNQTIHAIDSSLHKSKLYNDAEYNETIFWLHLKINYNFTLLDISREQFLQDMIKFEDLGKVTEKKPIEKDGHHKHFEHIQVNDKSFILMKWFYLS